MVLIVTENADFGITGTVLIREIASIELWITRPHCRVTGQMACIPRKWVLKIFGKSFAKPQTKLDFAAAISNRQGSESLGDFEVDVS